MGCISVVVETVDVVSAVCEVDFAGVGIVALELIQHLLDGNFIVSSGAYNIRCSLIRIRRVEGGNADYGH